jgi:hypothetical protein
MEVVYVSELNNIYLIKESGYNWIKVENDVVEGKFTFKSAIHTLPESVIILGDL